MADPTNGGLPEVFHDSVADKNEPPSAYFMNWFFGGADQRAPGAVVHQLGSAAHNASPGSHTHDGQDSQYMFGPTPALSPLAATATNAQIIDALNKIITHMQRHGAGVTRG